MNRALLVLSLVIAASCGKPPSDNDGDGPDSNGTTGAPTVTYYQDIKPVMDAHCARCHAEGGSAPFVLTGYEEAAAVATLIKPAVQARIMPPFLAAPAVRPLAYDTSLTDEQIELFATWVDEGAPMGDPEKPAAPLELEVRELDRVDLTVSMPVEYTPTLIPDEYRCFVISWPEEDVRYVTGLSVRPGNLTVAHHAVGFLIDPENVPYVDEADGADGKPGYPCFGGATPPGAPSFPTKIVAAWVPGEDGQNFPEGSGVRIDPGSKIVLQMHYSVLGEGAGPDKTAVDVRLDDEVSKNAGNLPWLDLNWPSNPESMLIPAGAAEVVHEYAADPTTWPLLGEFVPGIDPRQGIVIHSILPHLHKLGTSISLQVERADGTIEPLIDIPRWDFDWQSYFEFEEPVTVLPGDQLRIRCTYDNSATNQPVINGTRREPADVTWGEGTYDEMCAASMYVVGVAEASNDCAAAGSVPADEGTFVLTFKGDQIRGNSNIEGELRGPVRGAVYHEEDVTLAGPKDGAVALGDFVFEDVDLTEGDAGPYPLDFTLPAGEYHILGYMDTDGNDDPANRGPDVNDPVIIPARAHTMGCEQQPAGVNFPILLPDL